MKYLDLLCTFLLVEKVSIAKISFFLQSTDQNYGILFLCTVNNIAQLLCESNWLWVLAQLSMIRKCVARAWLIILD